MDDLRQGRLDITPHYFKVDMPFYKEHIRDFLPEKVIDVHAHVGTGKARPVEKCVFWPERVTRKCEMSVSALLDAYMKLLPGKDVAVVCFGHPERTNVDKANTYLANELREYPNIYGFALTLPEWSGEELNSVMKKGGFSGMKCYGNMVEGVPSSDVTILDIYPLHQLKLAEENGWIVMLHVPRKARLADVDNIKQLQEIRNKCPNLNLIIAHVGRAYFPEIAVSSLPLLKDLGFYYDISANTCQPVFELVLEEIGPDYVLYGSDLPIFAMRGKRECCGESYVNYIYQADWEDEHTRRARDEDVCTFMLFEEILAFKKAAEKCGLTREDIYNVFYGNAEKLLKPWKHEDKN